MALDDCNACVLVMPCGRSAHLELGYMTGQGKPCIVHVPIGVRFEPELMYKLPGMLTTSYKELHMALDQIDGKSRGISSECPEWDISF